MSDCVLRLDNVTKSFGPVEVIKGVDLTVRRGQVQALLGENGAGKSTLIKMIAGVHEPDSGRILVDGTEVKIPDTKASEALGIATIHQELNLVPTMSVAENIMLGRTPRRFGLVNRKHLKAQAQAALHLIGLDVDLDMPVGELGVAKQQLVEIAKALSMNARILILDEPTAALTGKEVDALFAVLEELKAKGVRGCVLYPMGAIDTPKNREAGLDWDRLIDPRGLAKSVAHALTRPDRAHVTELKVYPDV